MSTCKICNNQIPDGVKVCSKCGAKVKEDDSALLKNPEDEQDVLFLGKPDVITADSIEKAENAPNANGNPVKILRLFNKLSKKSKIIIAAAMTLIITAGTVLPFVLHKKEEIPVPVFEEIELPSITVYMKDDCLYAASLKEGKTKKVINGLQQNTNILDSSVEVKNNGTRVFYKMMIPSNGSYVYNLYYADLDFSSDKECSSVLINTEVGGFNISEDGKSIIYIRGSSNRLYYGSVNSAKEIDRGISYYLFKEDFSSVYYTKNNRDLYVFTNDTGVTNIAQNVSDFRFIAKTKTVYYLTDTNLYKYIDGKKSLIDSNVEQIESDKNSGEIYYSKVYSTKLQYYDIVDDDKLISDAALIYPQEPSEPKKSDFKNKSEYETAYKKYEDEYNNVFLPKKKECEDKWKRDDLRNAMSLESYNYQKLSIFYYNNSSITKIAENASILYSNDNSVLINRFSTGLPPKKSITSFSSISDINDYIASYYKIAPKNQFIYNDHAIDMPEGLNFFYNSFNDSENALYFLGRKIELNNSTSNLYYDLYKIEISGDNFSDFQKIDSDVYPVMYYTEKSKKIVYTKITDKISYSLYVGSEKVDTSYTPFTVYTIPESDSIIWATPNKANNTTKDIKLYNGSTTLTIAENAVLVDIYKSDCITYLKYNEKSKLNDLYLYDGSNEHKLLESGIQSIYMRVSLSGMYIKRS